MRVNGSDVPARKIVIVGGVAGGMSAAARARRLSEDSEIIVLERSGHVSYANCGLPYFLGGEIQSQDDLIVATPEALKNKLNLDIRVHNEVVEIDAQAKVISVRDTTTQKIYQESYDDLILSVGAAPIRPKIPGIDLPGLFTLRSIEDVEEIHSWFEVQKPRTAVIAGGGFIGLEMAEQLARRGLDVTLIDCKDQVLTPIDPEMAELVHNELRKHGVKLVLGKSIEGFRPPVDFAVLAKDLPKSCWVLAGDHEPMAADLVILLEGLTEQAQWHQVKALSTDGVCLLDVRARNEYDRGHIDGSLHIPLPELRKRLSEIPAGKDIVTYCQSGQRSYIASRLLKQKGFRVKNLSGGYLTWSSMQSSGKKEGAVQQITPTVLAR